MMNGINEFRLAWQGQMDVVVVDDGSSDNSSSIIKQHPLFPINTIQVITQSNTGKGGALKHGVQHARGEWVLTLDADMATSPLELLHWLTLKPNWNPREILIGSREINTHAVNDIWYRKLMGNVFNSLIRIATQLPIRDTQCGFKLYHRETSQVLFTALKTLGWAHDVELLGRAKKLGYGITEMPVNWTAIEGSKISVVRDSWKMFWELLAIRSLLNKETQ